ncbi:DUF1450 domain-containing protein [Xylanibacillus composti]|nr:DUF1450 domain-containing protein [Xylanibacillus composti]MDT9725770.1 DUF1450 domain-containing protein [Xylanibacillus composti]
MKKIKYCCRNLKRYEAKFLYKSMKDIHPELKHKKKDCLGECKLCSKQCFVMVGKQKLLCKQSADELYAELRKLIG